MADFFVRFPVVLAIVMHYDGYPDNGSRIVSLRMVKTVGQVIARQITVAFVLCKDDNSVRLILVYFDVD